jgi:predicted transcriptional regulator
MDEAEDHLRKLVAEVAAAYFSNNHVTSADIANVIQQIAQSLGGVSPSGQGEQGEVAAAGDDAPNAPRKKTPAQIRKSITQDALISFENNKPYKTLKRHLSTRGLTLDQYREKHGLPKDYPSVAPAYSAARSAMAKQIGLGAQGRGRAKAGTATNGGGKAGGRKAAGPKVGNG